MRMAFSRRSSFGMKCIQCGHELIAPERSEFRRNSRARHIWHCEKCSCCFETLGLFPAGAQTTKHRMVRDDNYLSVLVA